ncbi:MAG: hypothetical protein V8R51_06845 [Clostridia bacterium]
MKNKETEQYTFGTDEKEVLNKMDIVESSVGQKTHDKNQRKLVTTKYYSEFIISTEKGPITLNNVFITAEKD